MIERFKLSILKDIEVKASWPQMCNDPVIFFQEIAKRLFVSIDTNRLLQNIVISSSLPKEEDRGKLWVKTSWPYGIGFVANGEYQMDYGPSGLVQNTPFLHREFNPTPQYVSRLGDLQLDRYGMKNLNTEQDTPERMYWYIFEPPIISI